MSRAALRKEPYLSWNALIDLIAMSDYEGLDPIQRIAHLAFWYDSELQNGGHLQYFENRGTVHADETLSALVALGEKAQAETLRAAVASWNAKHREPIAGVEDYVDEALEDEFGELDERYHECQPELTALLKEYLDANEDQFIEYCD